MDPSKYSVTIPGTSTKIDFINDVPFYTIAYYDEVEIKKREGILLEEAENLPYTDNNKEAKIDKALKDMVQADYKSYFDIIIDIPESLGANTDNMFGGTDNNNNLVGSTLAWSKAGKLLCPYLKHAFLLVIWDDELAKSQNKSFMDTRNISRKTLKITNEKGFYIGDCLVKGYLLKREIPDDSYNFIINPKNDQKVSINSLEGKMILKNYLRKLL